MGHVGGNGTGLVSEEEVGGTDSTEVYIGLGVGGTCRTVSVSQVEVGSTGMTKVQTGEGVGGTEVLGSGLLDRGCI